MDKLYVRIITIILNIYVGCQLAFAYKGYYSYTIDMLFCCPIWASVLLVILGRKQSKYHCKYMRWLQYNMLAISSLNLIDSLFGIFSTELSQLATLSTIWIFFSLVSIYFALKHFIKWSIRKRKRKKSKGFRLR